MKNISVLGGGTAGWLTALYFKRVFPEKNINIIFSRKKGVIGVGEATTPPFVDFINFLGIDILDMLSKTGGTIKNGISFENWNGDNKKYFHPFKTCNKMSPWSIDPIFGAGCEDWHLRHLQNKNLDFDSYLYPSKLSYENKVDLDNVVAAVHFDTNKVSEYLEEYGKSLGINVINDEFVNVETNEDDFITKIILKNDKVSTDFVFDCSGFSRLIIGNHYKTKWKSYKKHLPMKCAIPFHIENNDNIPPYTGAIALPHGWMWQIPLQHRIGAGYVFDSDYISAEQAQHEVEEYLGKKINVNKVIKFDAGRFEKYWVKNCIAIGISSSFIEPLESSSIHMSVIQLKSLAQFFNVMHTYQEHSVNTYNKICTSHMDEILNFVYLHYITKRKDTDFWASFSKNYPIPENFKKIVDLIKSNELRYYDISLVNDDTQFSLYSYLCIAEGLQIPNKGVNIKGYENLKPNVFEYKQDVDKMCQYSLSHNDFIEKLQRDKNEF